MDPAPDPLRDPRFLLERELSRNGACRIAGVDEAGRGPLAGPVVVGAVMLPSAWLHEGLPEDLRGLNDSKQLTPSRREAFHAVLTGRPGIAWSVAMVESGEIDRLNILRATHEGMLRALAALDPAPDHVLVDGLRVEAISLAQTAVVKGDSRSYSIAAASVLAKVVRDRWMREADQRWPQYGFAVHKGYPTAAHLAALARHGPCPIHRRSFAPVAAAGTQPELFG